MAERPETVQRRTAETRSAGATMEIDATPEEVWKALTDARELERWFPLDATVEPGVGGSIWMSWRNEFAGLMRIQIWDPPHHLRTAWTFHEGEETGQVTDYVVEGRGGTTVVRAVTSGFPLDATWDDWVEGTLRGWAFELRSLKHYLERHAGQSRHVAYVRWRVAISKQEAWARLSADPEVASWLSRGEAFAHPTTGQHAAVLSDPEDALIRVSVEPGAPGGQLELVVWLSAWGDHEQCVREIEAGWRERLTRVFPEGATP